MAKRKACPVGRFVSLSELDINKVAPRLYLGGLGNYEGCKLAISKADLDIVVMLAPDAGVKFFTSKDGNEFPQVIELALQDDKSDLNYLPELISLAKQLARKIKAGKKVLCSCRLGFNRSGLICSLLLMNLNPTWSGKRIVRHVRTMRNDDVLTNPHFEKFIESIPGRE